MGYKFKCQKCGNDIIVKYCTIGEPVQCKSCGASNVVPEDPIETTDKPEYLLKYEARHPKDTFTEIQRQPETKETVITPGILGPRDFGEIVAETFKLYSKNFLKMIAIVSIPQIMLYIPILAITILYLVHGANTNPFIFIAVYFAMIVVSFIFTPLMECAIVYSISARYMGKSICIKDAYRFAFKKLGVALGAAMLASLCIGALTITIIAIPVALYFVFLWSFMFQIAMVEKVSPWRVLLRSSFLIKGFWIRIFYISLVLSLIGGIIYGILGIIPFIGILIGSILASPVSFIGIALLYFDMRVRKEGYTLEKLAEELALNVSQSSKK
ncbi:hypothetical protein KAU34_03560 [candidate division WOR-3 bacterium]|nr:hypothetical protein [candidate division WOR-3 bacterium]